MFIVANNLLFKPDSVTASITFRDLTGFSDIGRDIIKKETKFTQFSYSFVQRFLNENDFYFKKPSRDAVIDPLTTVAHGLVSFTSIDVLETTPKRSSNFDEVPMYRVLDPIKQLFFKGTGQEYTAISERKAVITTHGDATSRITAVVCATNAGSRTDEAYIIAGSEETYSTIQILNEEACIDPSVELEDGVHYSLVKSSEKIPQPPPKPKKDDAAAKGKEKGSGKKEASYRKSSQSQSKFNIS